MTYNFDELIERRGTDAYKYELMKDICGREDVLPMWVADMDFATPPFILEAIMKRVSQRVLGYTRPTEEYSNAIAKWCLKQYDWEVGNNDIKYIPGVVAGIYLAMQAFTEKGDRILIQDPVYHPFRIVPEGSQREVVWNRLEENASANGGFYRMNLDQLRKDIKGCKMMILCNPHNPAGVQWSRETLQEVAQICADEGVLVISDEIHCDMLLNGRKHIPFASVSDVAKRICITLQAPSKSFNMPGVVCAHAIVTDTNLRERYFSYIENSDMDLGNVFAFSAAIECYSERGDEWRCQMLEYVSGNVDLLQKSLAPYSDRIKVIRPEASFLVWLDCRGMGLNSQEELNRFIADKCELCLNPGLMFGHCGKGFMRMNVGCPRSIVEKAVAQITAVL